MNTSNIERTSEEWDQLCNILIIDPDGWDHSNFYKSWFEPITRQEFEKRMAHSILDMSKVDLFSIWKEGAFE